MVQHHQRHIQRIAQERPHMTHQLKREAEPVVITTPLRDEIPNAVVEEEEPLQDSLIRKLRIHPRDSGPRQAQHVRPVLGHFAEVDLVTGESRSAARQYLVSPMSAIRGENP